MDASTSRGPFPPSWVQICRWPALVNTLGRAEVEQAAALLVRACAVLEDRWQPLRLKQVLEVFRADARNGVVPWCRIPGNPTFRPDFGELVRRGFARQLAPESGHGAALLELTEAGVLALQAWTRPRFGQLAAAAAVARGDLTLRRLDSWGLAVWELAVDLYALGAVWTDEDLEPLAEEFLGVAAHG